MFSIDRTIPKDMYSLTLELAFSFAFTISFEFDTRSQKALKQHAIKSYILLKELIVHFHASKLLSERV